MSTDKRSTHTDALDTLGTAPIPADAGRDAIHLAVEPVVAGEMLMPAQRITLIDGVAYSATTTGGRGKMLGIVDPFMERVVMPGQRFWLVIPPRQITSLRHVWSHPDFPEEEGLIREAHIANLARDTVQRFPKVMQELAESEREDAAKAESERWLRRYADEMDLTYSRLMEGAKDYHESRERGSFGEYIIDGGRYEGACVPNEFWEHYQRVTGRVVDEDHQDNFFSCSC